MRFTFGSIALLVALAAPPAPGQVHFLEHDECDGNSGDRAQHCEVREETLPGGTPLDVDATPNGGIRVRGWDRGDVLLRTRVIGYAETEQQARQIASQVRVEAAGGKVRATGPQRLGDRYWTTGFELNVPQQAELTLKTLNGGISVRDLNGTVTFEAHNGGVRLENVGGDIRGQTRNGGLSINLTGDRWDGAGLDVETRNGGVTLTLPANYSAELETGTTNGRLRLNFPVAVQGDLARRVRATLGSGGPRIRAITYNGGVNVRHR